MINSEALQGNELVIEGLLHFSDPQTDYRGLLSLQEIPIIRSVMLPKVQ